MSRNEQGGSQGSHGRVFWFTGRPGSGKSTLSSKLARALTECGYCVALLDGDQVRKGLSADLGFSVQDRSENLRRLSHVASQLADLGMVCITATISPLRENRENARAVIGAGRFHEIHLRADIAICETRDPKGLYCQARAGLITDFTGISSPYGPPVAPELAVNTGELDVEASLRLLLEYSLGVLKPARRAANATGVRPPENS